MDVATYRLSVVVEKDDDGYVARCIDMQGCVVQGETYEAVLANLEDAVRLHIEERLARGEPVPIASAVSLTTIEIAV